MRKQDIPFWISIAGLLTGFTGIALNIFNEPDYVKVLLFAGFGLFSSMYTVHFALKKKKTPLDFVKLGLAWFWPLSTVFGLMHWPYKTVFQLPSFILVVSFYFMGGLDRPSSEEEPEPSRAQFEEQENPARLDYKKLLLGSAIVLVLTGALFKIQHWPYAPPMLIAGLLLGTAWFIIDSLRNKQ